MKAIKIFTLGAIFAIFTLTAFLVLPQSKRRVPANSAPSAKEITIGDPKSKSLSEFLPDTTKAKVLQAEMKGRKLDSIIAVMEKGMTRDKKHVDALKKQGEQLDYISRTLPEVEPITLSDSAKLDSLLFPKQAVVNTQAEIRRSLFKRIFRRK